MKVYLQAHLLKAELEIVDSRMRNDGLKDMESFMLLKQAFTCIANLVDYERSIRSLYRKHKQLSVEYAQARDEYAFAKYLRNIFIGHVKDALIEKTIEWKPELRNMLSSMREPKAVFLLNLFVLETAINTYVDDNQKHLVFDGEIDLYYPPLIMKGFLSF